ncbi:MAG: hypothetical protein Q4E57_11560 [Eubacteriales bacterium]|nr:hypothetical protein [Eubacteriales bacterium]
MTADMYVEKVNKFIVPYLGKNGFSLIKTEFVTEDGNKFLRLYIDLTEEELKKRQAVLDEAKAAEAAGNEAGAPDEGAEEEITPGVSINDCVKVSRYLSKWLDKEDFINEEYTMEVCSKGFLKPEQDLSSAKL